ncbi:hypothetical protein ZWY2020_004118 [Hordeum vulgare]|uniref:Uncharacterized protein n=1 Tax=Hordeum vulgare subsp. vulgare TaxID=112509 RepID=A0A8I6WSE8_HORVV|nr:hypothetical protein ZWY2020_004118 [Hordeum vulgare]
MDRHDALTGGSGRGRCAGSMSRRHGRFHHRGGDGGGQGAAPAVVDHADCTAQSCRSCVAVSLADCIALGCCPCAVVSLLGLALVKAPLALGRRCVQRLRRRHGKLQHKKRVRDMDLAGGRPSPSPKCAGGGGHREPGPGEAASKGGDDVATAACQGQGADASEEERVWLEMYQVGQWGFGRLSFSVNPPPRAGRNADGDGCESDV